MTYKGKLNVTMSIKLGNTAAVFEIYIYLYHSPKVFLFYCDQKMCKTSSKLK